MVSRKSAALALIALFLQGAIGQSTTSSTVTSSTATSSTATSSSLTSSTLTSSSSTSSTTSSSTSSSSTSSSLTSSTLSTSTVSSTSSTTSSASSNSNVRTVTGEYGCYTDYGSSTPSVVPTFSRIYSLTTPVTYYNYVTPSATTVTVTPSALPNPTLGFPDTTTITTTVTTFTFAASTFTSTVPVSAGFTPLASVINRRRGGFRAVDDSTEDGSGDVQFSEDQSKNLLELSLTPENQVVANPPLAPQQVFCALIVRIFTTTTTTFTVTGTPTTTVTLPPALPTGFTVPAQVTATTTTTETVTNTNLVVDPTFTAYRACQRDNLVSQVRGGFPIVEAASNWQTLRERRQTNSAYDCCVACQTTNSCQGSLYSSGTCFLFKGDAFDLTCPSPGFLRYSRFSFAGRGFTASNGQCGSWFLSRQVPGIDE
ncbi:hypothetical protein CMUS01_05267 [Colletotrichum musicola]|uniref:Apple domain-containing protein n=1 Tax=Colletotrichum musicola TaxID=2175873 RepID=A0A8H6KSD8_9PEZI|nr:hypothetical protein CMUS01_05267 [Colletotrichum musicola]